MAHILVVDDDAGVRNAIATILKSEGFAVTATPSGDEGLRLQRSQPMDVLICDMFLPGKNGIETISEFRREFPDVRIIAISGGALAGTADMLQSAKELGADVVLEKPFRLEALMAAVNGLL